MSWIEKLRQAEQDAREYYGIPLVVWELDPFDGESISHHTPRMSLAEEAEAAQKTLNEIRKRMPQVSLGIIGVGGGK